MEGTPQEGDYPDTRSTQVLVPQSVTVGMHEWTDGTVNVQVLITTQHAKYRVDFGSLQFIEFSLKCMERVTDYLKLTRKGK